MATPNTPLWERDPHTAAKHDILRAYLQAWFPILGRYNRRIVYLDGFAGPGEYTDHSAGSPLIALDVALEQRAHLPNEVVFYLIEQDTHRAEHLAGLVQARRDAGLPETFAVEVHCDEFASDVQAMLDEIDAAGFALAPTFAFIDPFGWSGLPMTLVHRLLGYQSTEAFINFAVDPVNRFIEHPNDKITAQMVELFGTEAVLTATAGRPSGYDALRELYGAQLRQAARHVRFFTMHRADDRPVYDLFFATNSLKGLEKMKEAMWRADPDGHFRFSDATDPSQSVLFDATAFVPARLLALAEHEFGGRTAVPVSAVTDWVLAETPYLGTHARTALRLGETTRRLTVPARKPNGQTRKAGTFPPDAAVDFVPPPAVPVQPSLFA